MEIATNLFDRFGGVRPMAEALKEPPSTVQSWKTAGRIPATKQPNVLARAAALGLDVVAADVVFPLEQRQSSIPEQSSVTPFEETAVRAGRASSHFDRAARSKRDAA